MRQSEVEKLFAAIGDHVRDHTIFTLMLHAGLRVGEVVNLRTRDIYLAEKRTPHLRVNGKGQRERIVYLSATAAQLLNEHLLLRPSESSERVFLNRRGKPITARQLGVMLRSFKIVAGSRRFADGNNAKGYLKTAFEEAFSLSNRIDR